MQKQSKRCCRLALASIQSGFSLERKHLVIYVIRGLRSNLILLKIDLQSSSVLISRELRSLGRNVATPKPECDNSITFSSRWEWARQNVLQLFQRCAVFWCGSKTVLLLHVSTHPQTTHPDTLRSQSLQWMCLFIPKVPVCEFVCSSWILSFAG